MCLVVFPYLQHFRFFAVDGWGLLIELDSVSTLLCRKNKSWNYNYAKDVQNTKFIFRIFPTLSALTEVRTGRTDRSLWTTNKLFSKVLAQKENHQLLFDPYDDDDGNGNNIIAIGLDNRGLFCMSMRDRWTSDVHGGSPLGLPSSKWRVSKLSSQLFCLLVLANVLVI